MTYKPENSKISFYIFLSLLILDLLLLILFRSLISTALKTIIILIFISLNLALVYLMSFEMTLKYHLNEKGITIDGAFGTKRKFVPLEDILYFTRSITMLDIKGLKGINTGRFALGKFKSPDGENASLYITSSRKTILIYTSQGVIGISPEEAENFSSQLKLLGVEQRVIKETSILKSENVDLVGRNRMKVFFIYTAAVIVLFIAIPQIVNALGLFPKYINISSSPEASAYVTRDVHLMEVLMNSAIVFFILIITSLTVMNLSTVDGVHYYQLMYVPLVIAVFYLFKEVSIIIGAVT